MTDHEGPRVKVLRLLTVPTSLIFIEGQIEYLKIRGFDITVVTSPGKHFEEHYRTEGIATHSIPMTRMISPVKDLVALWRIFRLIRRERPAIVHASTPKAGFLGMVAGLICSVPVRLFTCSGLVSEMPSRAKGILLRFLERWTCSCATDVIAVSRSLEHQMIAFRLCPADKINLLGKGSSNGVDADLMFNPDKVDKDRTREILVSRGLDPSHSVVIGFVGRVVRDKGLCELAEAWCSVFQSFPSSWLLIVGSPEPRDPMPDSILSGLRNHPHVIMVDFVPRSEIPSYYAMMNLLVLPTYREGFPNVVLEASAMGLPVVATRVTGCVDAVLDGITGTLVSAGDFNALAQAIVNYLRDPDLCRRHGTAGREGVIQDFNQAIVWEALHKEYCRLLLKQGYPLPLSPTFL